MTLQDALNAEQLRAALDYDPETGIFRWRIRADMPKKWNTRYAGTVAGRIPKPREGYVVITVNNRSYRAHRLAWLYVTGEWPIGDLDHVNGKTGNNWFSNLREATRTQNNINQKCHNRHGLKGIKIARSGRWVAYIKAEGKLRHLGTFDDPQSAHEAYWIAAQHYFGEFARKP
jgi:hypothetical protein